jgi:hypothetical protein
MIEPIYWEQSAEQGQKDSDNCEMYLETIPIYSRYFFATYIKEGRRVRPVPSRIQIIW